MTTIDIFSGFLGAGKTTLIKKMIQEAYNGEKLVLIENEFGEIGIDGGFMQDAGIEVNEMNSGCICCSLVGDFGKALVQVIEQFHPDRILIEPSGVGKLSDVIGAVRRVESDGVKLGSFITVADATKCKVYLKNFGEFYLNQIETASTIILSRTSNITPEKLAAAASLLREHNSEALIITTPWDELTGKQILDAMQQQNTLNSELAELLAHEQHHHHHDEDCDCPHCHGEHEHHHDHHGHHHADDVFTSWGIETAKKFTADEIESILKELDDEDRFGMVLRAKGIVASTDGTWIHFDHVPHEIDIRSGSAAVTGRICVIGAKLNEEAIASRFGV